MLRHLKWPTLFREEIISRRNYGNYENAHITLFRRMNIFSYPHLRSGNQPLFNLNTFPSNSSFPSLNPWIITSNFRISIIIQLILLDAFILDLIAAHHKSFNSLETFVLLEAIYSHPCTLRAYVLCTWFLSQILPACTSLQRPVLDVKQQHTCSNRHIFYIYNYIHEQTLGSSEDMKYDKCGLH